MKKKIITDIKYLKKKSKELVSSKEKDILIRDLEDSLDIRKGIGLSAIQIGIPRRVAIIRLGTIKLNLVNPVITHKEKVFKFSKEGCLSLPGLALNTERYYNIRLENDGEFSGFIRGMLAVAIQHEIDHMNGITILDRQWREK